MRKRKQYVGIRFRATAIKEASEVMASLWTAEDKKNPYLTRFSVSVGSGTETWYFDNHEEFLNEIDQAEYGNYIIDTGGPRRD